MATPPLVSDNPIVQQHYLTQQGLSEVIGDTVVGLDPNALAPIAREFQSASISLSADYYTEIRDAENVPGAYRQPVTDPWEQDRLSSYLRASTDSLTGADLNSQAVAVVQRLTLDAGISQIFAAMDSDPRRPRWARVVRPSACSFCVMLATRGAVYRSEDSADFRAHSKMHGRGGVCQCGVEPSFTKYEPPSHIRSAQSLYANSVEDSMSPVDKRNAFRRALDAERSTTR